MLASCIVFVIVIVINVNVIIIVVILIMINVIFIMINVNAIIIVVSVYHRHHQNCHLVHKVSQMTVSLPGRGFYELQQNQDPFKISARS